jgi:hypothetical protein
MKKNEDPAKLFEHLSQIENRFTGIKIDQADLIAVVLNVAPRDYQSILAMETRNKGVGIKLADLEAVMNQYWQQLSPSDHREQAADDTELSLGAFQGTCFNCHKVGHRANKCPDKKGTRSKRFSGKCQNCGKDGHRSEDCWLKEENKSKRPSFYRHPGERGAAAVETDEMEFLLMGITFPMTKGLLSNPNVWCYNAHDAI